MTHEIATFCNLFIMILSVNILIITFLRYNKGHIGSIFIEFICLIWTACALAGSITILIK